MTTRQPDEIRNPFFFRCELVIFIFMNLSMFKINRNTIGRPRKFETVEDLLLKWEEYVDSYEKNSWVVEDYVGKDAKKVNRKKTVPMSKFMFAHFCDCHQWQVLEDLKKVSDDFSKVVTRIEELIYAQKMHGASVGVFNSSIIASELGLKTRLESSGKVGLNLTVSKDINEALNDALGDGLDE